MEQPADVRSGRILGKQRPQGADSVPSGQPSTDGRTTRVGPALVFSIAVANDEQDAPPLGIDTPCVFKTLKD